MEITPLITVHPDASLDTIRIISLVAATAASIIVPLLTPFHNDVHEEPSSLHPSAVCSPIVRWWTYGWINPFVATAYRMQGEVTWADIPILTKRSGPWSWWLRFCQTRQRVGSTGGAMWVLFRPRVAIMGTCMIFCGLAEFLGAIGLRSLLNYLQGSSPEGSFTPWFSALLFGASPIIRGLCMQTFESFSTEGICHLKSMVTSTIFEKLLKQKPGVRPDSGKVTNHVAADLDKIAVLRYTIMAGFMVPVEVAVASVLLYQTIGWSYVPGLIVMAAARIPISWYINRFQGRAQSVVMNAIDARVRRVSEVIKGLQTVQMLGQSLVFERWVDEKREAELAAIWNKMKIVVTSDTLSSSFVLVPLILSLGFYTMVEGRPLTPAVVFTTVSIFNTLKNMMSLAVIGVSTNAQAMVSLRRVLDFLDEESSQGDFWNGSDDARYQDVDRPPPILGAREGTVQALCQSGNWRTVVQKANFDLVAGGLNVITGKTGSGKSTLLKALIREAHVSGGVFIIRSKDRDPISYAGQTPWLHHGTVRENILFNAPFSERRYNEVLQATGLKIDLQDFPAGDATDVGERGQSLSGGQRARVALARAVYADTQTVVLDDVLAALDAKTSRAVVDTCILGPLMKGRTIVLVTEDSTCREEADLLLELSNEGALTILRNRELPVAESRVHRTDTSAAGLLDRGALNGAELISDTEVLKNEPGESCEKSEKLISGLIGKNYILKYMRLFGSKYFLCCFCGTVLLAQATDVLLSFWLTLWSKGSGQQSSQQQKQASGFYLGIYTGLGVIQLFLVCVSSLMFFYGALRASRTEHSQMLSSVFRTTLAWATATPVGVILNRFSSDIFSLDNTITELLKQVVENFLSIGFRLAAVSTILPTFLIPAILLLGVSLYIGQVYLYGSTAAKRIYAASLSPIITSINDVISGIEVIRAHQEEEAWRNRFYYSLEHYLRGWEAISATQRWLAVRMDFCAGSISLLTAVLAITSRTSPAAIGFSMTSATTLCTALLYIVYLSSLLQVEMNCFQRIEEYIHAIPQERQSTPGDDTPLGVDLSLQSGHVKFENFSSGYTLDGDVVLSEVNLEARPGQRVAIVGRSGSGKSSLAAALLRLTETFRGRVLIGGCDIETIEVSELRQRICFIPQNPTLFTGSLRFNLDFGGRVSDERLQEVLSDVMGDAENRAKWTLDTHISADGSNLSHGERQLIALARALVTDASIVLIDEATASVDSESEKRIHRLLKERFYGKTLIAIAHRLAPVVEFDWVCVMEQGKIVEQGDPQHLISVEGGKLWKLWNSASA
ncbi:unnamed protein product [Clonostachys rhizophaga]|uniref:P-loop containing nucleoside triphosphate hydrolase protein n=1 Tax=Clonostachys rhizophaga TaxID=160324 RepID=A0A9N9VT69_9HYPO|nr:unnamed protein product [Clonostachys rhizophaga]